MATLNNWSTVLPKERITTRLERGDFDLRKPYVPAKKSMAMHQAFVDELNSRNERFRAALISEYGLGEDPQATRLFDAIVNRLNQGSRYDPWLLLDDWDTLSRFLYTPGVRRAVTTLLSRLLDAISPTDGTPSDVPEYVRLELLNLQAVALGDVEFSDG